MRKYLTVLAALGVVSTLGVASAFADPSQPPQGKGAPLEIIKNTSPDANGRYQDLVGNTAVSAWAGEKSGGHANVCGNAAPGGNQPGDGC